MFTLYMVKYDYVVATIQLLTYSYFHLDNFWDCFHPKIGSYVPLVAFGIKINCNHMPYTKPFDVN
jgi:hypothetical protein